MACAMILHVGVALPLVVIVLRRRWLRGTSDGAPDAVESEYNVT